MKKKVVFCASTLSHIINFHLPYLKFFKEKGWEVHVIADGNQDIPFTDKIYDIKFTKKIVSLNNLKSIQKIVEILSREKYNLISVHTALAGVILRIAYIFAKQSKANIIYIVHGYLFSIKTSFVKKFFYVLIEKLLSPVTTCLITMNQEDYYIANRYNLCKGKIINIPGMGIDLKKFVPISAKEKIKLRQKYNISKKEKILIYIGEFSKRKNQIFLINVMKEISPIIPNLKLILIGDGALFEVCKNSAKELLDKEKIVLTGYTRNIKEYLGIADIVISSSKSEGLPFNILEAMGCGLPIIASRVKGHVDLIQEGKNGLLFTLHDEGEISNKLCILVKDIELQQRLGIENKKIVKQYGLENVYKLIVGIYNEYI